MSARLGLMNTTTKALLVAIPAAILGFALELNGPLGAALWPEPPAGPEPAGAALGALMGMGVLEALAFGAGVAFLVFGWAVVQRAPGVSKGLATGAYLAIAWLFVNWVPHSAMHMTNAHDDFARLALIEYVFHFTLMLGGATLALFFLRVLRASPARMVAPEAPADRPLVAAR